MSAALAGRRIVVTRPAGQNDALAGLIRAAGGEPIEFPVLEIAAVDDQDALLASVDRLEQYDLAVFVSPNAVNKAMSVIAARRTWPAGLRAATVGPGSAKALRECGLTDVIVPTARFDSEALLELEPLQDMQGKRVVIFRGDGGRELLGDTLRRRGATVDYVECYRRVRPDIDVEPLLRAAARNEIDGVVATSSEGLRNLHYMIGDAGRQWLRRTPLFVPHARIADTARALGHERVVQTAPGDEGIVSALATFSDKV